MDDLSRSGRVRCGGVAVSAATYYRGVIYDVLKDCLIEDGAVVWGNRHDAEKHALKLAELGFGDRCDCYVQIEHPSGICEIDYNNDFARATGGQP